MRLVIATHNQHKLTELQQLLAPLNLDVEAASDYDAHAPEETASTFIENALIKARHTAKVSGAMALADDSGLVVPALHGAPGIHSARYSGASATSETNMQKLVQAMASLHGEQRAALFYCVLVIVKHEHDPMPLIAEGIWHGTIAHAPKGAHGFGYDPLFFLPDLNKTAAELQHFEKNALSHRHLAFSQLMNKWPEYV